MANRKITEMTAHTAPATDDVLPIIDVSETAATNKNKKITVQELFKGVPDGTAAAPGLAFESDDGNGIYLAGTDTVGISTGGTERVTVNASGDVSISGSLTVAGATTTIESTTITVDDKNIELGSVATPTDTTADGGGITLKGATDKTINWVNSTGYWTFNTGIEVGGHIEVDDSNEIRIGTSQDLKLYHDSTNSVIQNTEGDLFIYGGEDEIYIRAKNDEDGIVVKPNAEVELYYNGNKRFETSSAGATLTGALQASQGGTFESQTSTTEQLVIGNTVAGSGGSDLVIRKARGGTGDKAQINAGDQLGEIKIAGYAGSQYNTGFRIQCTSTTNTNYFAPTTNFHNNNTNIFSLVASSGTQFNTNIFTSDASNGSLGQGQNGFILKAAGGRHDIARDIGANSAVIIFFGSAGQLNVKGDGDCENTNNRYGGTSDSKLKENIVDASSQWDDIKAVRVRNYNFKAETNYPTHTQIGVVAQELETVCPGLVQDNIDEDSEGNDLGTRTKSVAYSVLYMKAVKALQEAMTRIETLEAKVAALEAAN
tara:strand:- start:395 stop:2020 length:1626 start_codon:yes stop_codon:yes gene_type:complete